MSKLSHPRTYTPSPASLQLARTVTELNRYRVTPHLENSFILFAVLIILRFEHAEKSKKLKIKFSQSNNSLLQCKMYGAFLLIMFKYIALTRAHAWFCFCCAFNWMSNKWRISSKHCAHLRSMFDSTQCPVVYGSFKMVVMIYWVPFQLLTFSKVFQSKRQVQKNVWTWTVIKTGAFGENNGFLTCFKLLHTAALQNIFPIVIYSILQLFLGVLY